MSDQNSTSNADAEQDDEFFLQQLNLDRRNFMKAGTAVGAATALAGCTSLLEDDDNNGTAGTGNGDHGVPPGDLDEYYAFLSGGHSGDIRVLGVPSMREIMRIPVFNRESARGYGFEDDTQEMLEDAGGQTWGDTHHPRVSQTDNDYDGRWAFVNDKANGRIARIDLTYFETDAIVDIPNQQGTHGACLLLPDTKYVFGVGELRVPMPNDGRDVHDPEAYTSTIAAVDPETMNVAWQVEVDGNMDNADSGKQGEWFFATGYNSDGGVTQAEMSRPDRDYTKAFNISRIEEAVDNGEYETINDVPVVDGTKDSPLNQGDDPAVRYVPTPKSPHGVSVTPDGEYAVVSGKLDPTTSIIEIDALNEVDDPEDAIVGRPRLGMGPLHTAYDGRGQAYTTLFIDSQVVKWDIEAAVDAHPENGEEESPAVVEKIDVHYNPGHLIAAESYTADPQGDYLISLNKLSKDRFLNVGPVHPENDQLIYIGDDDEGMQLLKDSPAYPEPHDATIVHRDKIEPERVYDPDDLEYDYIDDGDERVERVADDRVEIDMWSIRNEFGFHDITVQEGDTVEMTVTNLEQESDILHSVAIPEHDVQMRLAPQETSKVTFEADDPGVYWMYCAYFCSALHLEMRSRFIVEPEE